MGKSCQAPESIPGFPPQVVDTLGQGIEQIAEDKIFDHYCRRRGTGTPSTIFPNRGSDGTQIFRDTPPVPGQLNNTKLFINFLKANNPQVDEINLFLQMNQPGAGIKNPDWMTHRPSQSELEFYEVKPDSNSGRVKGPAKILFLIALCGSQTPPLPYVPGTLYFAQNEEDNLWIETKGFIETEITLQWSRTKAGLILYRVCIESKLKKPSPEKAKSAVDAAAMILMWIIMSGVEAGPALEI
jgi:hypothetical protein